MSLDSIGPMVGYLSVEPGAQRRDQRHIACSIAELGSAVYIPVVERNCSRLRRFEQRKTGHLVPLDAGRPSKVPLMKLRLHLAQVLSNQGDLLDVGEIPDDHPLDTIILGLREDMKRRRKLEGLGLRARLRNLGLTGRIGRVDSSR